MAKVKWTKEQEQAIYQKNSNILVAAAAGSGKTAVLVERMIQKIVEDKIDIDKILIVTFTNAAASEMRERILNAIYAKLEEFPEDKNLQRQILLLNRASICTIDSFCLDVIRNNFFEVDVPANFRIADTAEIELLKQEIIEEILEEKYIAGDEGFLQLVDTYTEYRDDQPLKDLILKMYSYIQSNPFPEEWLSEKIKMLEEQEKQEFAESIYGKIVLKELGEFLQDAVLRLTKLKKKMERWEELNKYTAVIREDIIQLQSLMQLKKWNGIYQMANYMEWTKWPVDKKITIELKQEAKEIRDAIKKEYSKQIGKIVKFTMEEIQEDIAFMYPILLELQKMVLLFSERFYQKKKEKNKIDFNDIEHLALKILVKKEGKNVVPTDVAKKMSEKFEEIAIDEYQDSNLVQEYILNSISKGNNTFMVGDVKQSIYKFRQARPELFLEKYAKYELEPEEGRPRKIQLFKNFRSREEVLTFTNLIFEAVMSKELGEIEYTQEEYLNVGADFPNIEASSKAELHIIEMEKKEDTLAEEEEEYEERVEDAVVEAKFVANKIKELVTSGYPIVDKKEGIRPITYKDIAILLRATTVLSPIYEKELIQLGIPVFSDTTAEYLDSIEIQTVISLLKIVDNPMQDIPLITVLRSAIGGFSDNDLVEIRLADKNSLFYEAMLKAQIQVSDKLKRKIQSFLKQLETWREEQEYLSLDELIWKTYQDTGYYHYVSLMSNGELRQANLKMLFEKAKQYESANFKGLFQFIHFIDQLKLNSGDMSAAKLIGENENVVRIMSIHKSKGLEFPVVILANTGKGFNFQDLKEPILLHQELGIVPSYIDAEKGIQYNTLQKEAVRIEAKKETMAEEMRILYVALTRSKEKLIITGIQKGVEKKLREKEELLELYEQRENQKLNVNLVKRYKTYLDWIEMSYLSQKEKISGVLEVFVHLKEEEMKQWKQEEKEKMNALEKLKEVMNVVLKENKKEAEMNEIRTQIEWQYAYQELAEIPSKTSVTKMKEIEIENQFKQIPKKENSVFTMQPKEMRKPNFIRNEKESIVTNAQKGTLIHLCIQKMRETEEYDEKAIRKLVDELVEKQIITKVEGEAIDIQKLYQYTKSSLWKGLKKAKKIVKEQPFYLSIPANEVYASSAKDGILVQGMIDLYYEDELGDIVLVDYKTDYVEEGKEKELIEKYQKQLELYRYAMEQAMQKKVKRTIIYSLCLQKEIIIEQGGKVCD